MKNKKFNLSGAVAFAIAVLVLIIFIPINLIANYTDKVYDMTPAKKYTLNDITVKLLNDTSDKQIEVYFLVNRLEAVKEIPEYLSLYHTLSQLRDRDNIELICFDPNEKPDMAKTLDPTNILGVEAGDVFVKCGDIIKRVSRKKIFQTTSDGIVQYAGEELIAAAIKTCTSGSLPTIYFLQGHGEKSVETNYSTYAKAVKANNYDAKDLDLAEELRIPENTAIIYLVAPQKDISSAERTLLTDFLDNGGSVSMLLPPCETEGRFENIEYILRKFGIEMDYNIVAETNPTNQLQNRESVQDPYFFSVVYPPKTDDFTEDLTTDINYMISKGAYKSGISHARSMTQLPDNQFENNGNFEVSSVIRNIANTSGSYTTESKAMGGDAETAAYANDKLSNVQLDFGFYSYNKSTGGKLFAVGSSDMIDNDGVTYDVSGTQYLTIFSNTWLKDIDVDMGIGNKSNAYDTLEFADAKAAKKVMGMTTILPISIMLFGILVWLKRRHA